MATRDDQKTVIIITDDGPELRVIASTLDKAGFNVVTTSYDALPLNGSLQHNKTTIDLAIIDLPRTRIGTNCADLVHALHENYPNIRLLFLSLTADRDGSELGPAGHIRGYLRKPVRRAQLLGTVLKIVDAPAILAA